MIRQITVYVGTQLVRVEIKDDSPVYTEPTVLHRTQTGDWHTTRYSDRLIREEDSTLYDH